MCLRNISKDFAVNNLDETGLNGYEYDFPVALRVLMLMIDIHKYLMKKNNIKYCLDLLRKCLLDY